MGRLCERPGCSEAGVVGYGFDADRCLVWLNARDPDAPRDDLRGGVLCRRHADAMVVPRGWTLDDRREPTPRLFRAAAGGEPARKPKRRRTPRAGRGAAAAKGSAVAPVATLPLDPASPPARATSPRPVATPLAPASPPARATSPAAPRTVADVTGPSPTDDPDETAAIPWMPEFDIEDDLGGVLRADTPLLARAFRGTDRRR
jgi:hypothetical protein